MRNSELTKLRRKRQRIHRQFDKLEPLVAGYRALLRDTEARIHEPAPSWRCSYGAESRTRFSGAVS